MKANQQNLALLKGAAFEQILEYKENSVRVFTDFTNYVFKGQIRANREVTGTLYATFTIAVVGLGQISVSLTDVKTDLVPLGSQVYDILASVDGIEPPELLFTGTVVTSAVPVAVTPKYATQWENVAPVSVATPVAGEVADNSTVVLSSEVGAKIYFTTDGTVPTAIPARLYTAPIVIADAMTIKFFAVDTAGNVEVLNSAAYTIAP